MRKSILVTMTLCLCIAMQAQDRLIVNADQGKETISKHIYGHFSEHLGRCIYGGYWVGEDSPIPGGFNNVTAEEFKRQSPTLVANTRAAELAKFVVYESPFTVMCEHPQFVLGQPGADFLKIVPVVWDNIKFLDGAPDQYVAIAKQSGDSWFIGVLNNSVEREIKLNTGFLPAGKYTVEIWEDAKDAGKNPKNIRRLTQTLEAGKILKVKMARAGGYVAHIKPANGNPVYMFSYFKGNGEDGLHLAFSKDCYKWEALNRDSSFLTPELSKDKLMRDPCIIKGGDGLFHLVWTVSWSDKGIGYASSKDLIHWSEQKYIPVMAHRDSVRNCWAPEITYDETNGEYMIYWSSTVNGEYPDETSQYGHRIYYVTTKDFNVFSKAKLLFDPGYMIIDANIVRAGKRWVMFYKDERYQPLKKDLNIAYAKKLKGPYKAEPKPITQTEKYLAEGPTAVKVNDWWIVYFDKFNEGKYGAIRSKDLKTWEDISSMISLPAGARHGTIFEVTESFFKQYMSSYNN